MIMQVQQFDLQTLQASSPLPCHLLSSPKQQHYRHVQLVHQTESSQQAVSSNVPESNVALDVHPLNGHSHVQPSIHAHSDPLQESLSCHQVALATQLGIYPLHFQSP